jgi:hypothetical protein
MKKLIAFLLVCFFVACAENPDKGEYQLTLEQDYMILKCDGRFVARLTYDRVGVLDSILITDNQ